MQSSALQAQLPRSASLLKVDDSERLLGGTKVKIHVTALREC